MIHELEIQIGTLKTKAFLQHGFYQSSPSVNPFHYHNYTEVHLISGGLARFEVGKQILEVSDGTMLVIPRTVFHRCIFAQESTRHTAFQLDREVSAVASYSLPQGMSTDFFAETQTVQSTEDYSRIVAYIAVFCSYLKSSSPIRVKSVSDYGFLIREFFSLHYKENVHLCDLARELHLSERQAERLVLIHTGNTFREELTLTRLTIAERLTQGASLSQNEIAEYVGYKSYAGFWKAKKKHEQEKVDSKFS